MSVLLPTRASRAHALKSDIHCKNARITSQFRTPDDESLRELRQNLRGPGNRTSEAVLQNRVLSRREDQGEIMSRYGAIGQNAEGKTNYGLTPPFDPLQGLNQAERASVRHAFETFDARDLQEAGELIGLAFASADADRRYVLDGIHRCLRLAHLHTQGVRFAEALRVAEDATAIRGAEVTETRSAEERSSDALEVRKVAEKWLALL